MWAISKYSHYDETKVLLEIKSIYDKFSFQFVMVDDLSYDMKSICDNFLFQFVMIDASIIIEMSPN
jgi:hypothetical protein